MKEQMLKLLTKYFGMDDLYDFFAKELCEFKVAIDEDNIGDNIKLADLQSYPAAQVVGMVDKYEDTAMFELAELSAKIDDMFDTFGYDLAAYKHLANVKYGK